MSERPPFIYISGLPRTGSTLISEVLTELPYSFIFNEPHLGKNYFAVQDQDLIAVRACGVDLRAFRKRRLIKAFLLRRGRWLGLSQDYFIREFKRHLVPMLSRCVRQIGVKEIKHTGWENYAHHFPEMKVIMLARDPRDIYLSYFRLWKTGVVAWKGEFTPAKVANFINREFSLQLSISQSTETMKVRYEDFCTQPEMINRVKSFIKSQIPNSGKVGAFVSRHRIRRSEWDLHGGKITQKSINRWREESDRRLLEQSHEFFNLLSDYSNFWGYVSE